MPDRSEFAQLTDPFRGELLVHCYRMLGSIDEAEDLVQETYLRAWRSFDGYEGRASLRTWLYRIATNTCLNAIERGRRRVLPAGLVAPGEDPEQRMAAAREIAWLQPAPDSLLATRPPDDPAAVVGTRSRVRLAFVAALQHLPARQRAVLILREVLAWRAGEVAELLDTTTAAVNSALQRARAQLAEAAPVEEELAEPSEPERRVMLDRFIAAFEGGDTTTLMELLLDDVVWEMPPIPVWFQGRAAVGRFLATRVLGPPGAWRLVPIAANGQPAVALYQRDRDGLYRAHAIQVLTMTAAGVARAVAFLDPALFAWFGLATVHRGHEALLRP